MILARHSAITWKLGRKTILLMGFEFFKLLLATSMFEFWNKLCIWLQYSRRVFKGCIDCHDYFKTLDVITIQFGFKSPFKFFTNSKFKKEKSIRLQWPMIVFKWYICYVYYITLEVLAIFMSVPTDRDFNGIMVPNTFQWYLTQKHM